MGNTITSANAKLTVTVPSLSTVPSIMQGFAVDDAFDTDPIVPTERKMGVDGVLSAGFTPVPTPLKFTLQADSDSIAFMDQWQSAQETQQEALIASASLVVPSIGKLFTFVKGFLAAYTKLPPGKKTLEPQHYTIEFESCTPSPI